MIGAEAGEVMTAVLAGLPYQRDAVIAHLTMAEGSARYWRTCRLARRKASTKSTSMDAATGARRNPKESARWHANLQAKLRW
jgi:hypothetical protein